MKAYPILCVVLGLVLVVALGGCKAQEIPAPTEQPTGEAPVGPGETPLEPTAVPTEGPVILRIGGVTGPDCLHPFACSDHWYFVNPIYEGFTWYGEDCEVVPALGKSMEVSDDGLTWTIQIPEGVTFSDGTPVDAQAVKDYWDWQVASEVGSWFAPTRSTVSTEAVDATTFRFTTSEPVGSWPTYDSIWQWVLPASVWKAIPAEEFWDYENLQPIGTGPYVLTEWVAGEHLIYDARPDYWGGKPPIDRIVYQQFSNWDAIVQALLAGDIDLTNPTIPIQYYDTLVNAPNVTLESKAPGYWYYIVFNLAAEGKKHPAIDDPKVREALDYAIDKQQLIDVALLGHGITCPTAYGCGPIFQDFIDPSLEVTPFDLAKANSLLEGAGYKDTDDDGVREATDGSPLEFRLFLEAESPEQVTMADMLTGWFSQVGVTTQVEAQESGTLLDLVQNQRDYDMALRLYSGDTDPAYMDFVYSCWAADPGGPNDAGYCNPEFDDLLYQLIATVGTEERLPITYQAEALIARDRPMINLAGQEALQAYRSDRFKFEPNSCSTLSGMWDQRSLMRAEVLR